MARPTIEYSVSDLFRLWQDETLKTEQVAQQIGVSTNYLYAIAKRHGLPRRKGPAPVRDLLERQRDDPTPEEIEELKRDLREKHFAEMRAESVEASRARAWRQRNENLQDAG
jgi:hypothetical protein